MLWIYVGAGALILIILLTIVYYLCCKSKAEPVNELVVEKAPIETDVVGYNTGAKISKDSSSIV